MAAVCLNGKQWPDPANTNASGLEAAARTTQFIKRGIFSPGPNAYSFGSVSDGLSNTIAFSETGIMDPREHQDGNPASRRAIRGGRFAVNPVTNNWRLEVNPSLRPVDCLNSRDPMDRNLHQWVNFNGGSVERGLQRWDGRAGVMWFDTVLPPNAPTCGTQTDGPNLLTANSHHSGGVNVSFADGSVRFVSDTVDTGDLTIPARLGHPGAANDGRPANNFGTGHSAYGVWGAMGSKDGGESRSL